MYCLRHLVTKRTSTLAAPAMLTTMKTIGPAASMHSVLPLQTMNLQLGGFENKQIRNTLSVMSQAPLTRRHAPILAGSQWRIKALTNSNRDFTTDGDLKKSDEDEKEVVSDSKKVACEFFIQIMFNYLSCSAVAQAVTMSGGNAMVQTGLTMAAHAVILPLVIYTAGETSGAHFNPVITSVFVALGKLPAKVGLAYVIAQLAGGVIGAAAAFSSLPAGAQNLAHAGIQAVPATSSIAQAFMGEIYGAFALVFVLCSTNLDPRCKWGKLAPLSIPMVICLLMWLLGPVSSMCINPARAFGPALVTGFWENHWIWWTAPFIGGLSAAKIYQAFLPKGVKL